MMATIFSKLNLKQQSEILVVHAPASFEAEVARLTNVTVRRSVEEMPAIEFVLAFVTQQEEVNQLTQAITVKTKGDALVWFAYPKGASKKYKCDFNRDTGWAELGKAGFEPVRMVAIDEDWSALRFRRVEYIKTPNSEQNISNDYETSSLSQPHSLHWFTSTHPGNAARPPSGAPPGDSL